jgi:hypothetical protein
MKDMATQWDSKMIKLSIPIILLKRKNGTLHLKPCMENGTFELRYWTSRSSAMEKRQSTGSFVAKDIVKERSHISCKLD